jgi:large subunit ribosomal protein L15
MLQLNTIKAQPGATRNRKRLGRGSGSGHGPTAGKGDKGQLARSGGHVRPGFEGGQMPLYRRLPKRGFTNPGRRDEFAINLGDLGTLPASVKEVTLATLGEAGIAKGRFDRLVILGNGEIKRAVAVKAHRVSASARAKIEKAGGSVELLAIPGAQKREKKAKK